MEPQCCWCWAIIAPQQLLSESLETTSTVNGSKHLPMSFIFYSQRVSLDHLLVQHPVLAVNEKQVTEAFYITWGRCGPTSNISSCQISSRGTFEIPPTGIKDPLHETAEALRVLLHFVSEEWLRTYQLNMFLKRFTKFTFWNFLIPVFFCMYSYYFTLSFCLTNAQTFDNFSSQASLLKYF